MNPTYAPQRLDKGGPRISPKILMIAGGLIGAVIIALGFSVITSLNSPKKDMDTLLARLNTLQQLIDVGVKNVRGTEIRQINSSAALIISGDIRKVQTALATQGVGKASKAATAKEADKELFTDLENARVNGRFDAAYATALEQKLADTNLLLQDIYSKTKSNSAREALSASYKDFSQIQKDLEKL